MDEEAGGSSHSNEESTIKPGSSDEVPALKENVPEIDPIL
jgi:hypothetical protein